MERLTRPYVSVDKSAGRFIGSEVNIQVFGDKMLHLILNGPTINSVNKDSLRHIIRQLYTELKRYENLGMKPEEFEEMCENIDTRMLQWFEHKYGIGAGRMMELAEADKEGRLTIIPPPAKEGDPKPSCFYNDNCGLWCNGMSNQDGDEPTERCKQCFYCELGYAAEEG